LIVSWRIWLKSASRDRLCCEEWRILRDRKSTCLNSSHLVISYAVFCLKKEVYLYTNAILRKAALPHPPSHLTKPYIHLTNNTVNILFFLNDAETTEISSIPLHDPLPI